MADNRRFAVNFSGNLIVKFMNIRYPEHAGVKRLDGRK